MTSKNFIPRNSVLGDKLRNLLPSKGNNRNNQKTGRNDHQRPMAAPKGADGVNHINISDDSVTDLGCCLAHSTLLPLNHKKFGRFSNIEAFWHYIRSEEHDDRIRNMSGKALKDFAQMLHTRRVVNFVAIILDANWQKVNQYPDLKEAIKVSTLPFECYTHFKRQDGVKIRPTFSYWLIPGFEEIRKALQENRQPDFSEFLDNPNVDLFDDVFPKDDSDIVPASSIVEPVEKPLNQQDNKELAALLRRAVDPVVETAPAPESPAEAVEEIAQETVQEVTASSDRIPDEATRMGEFNPFEQPPVLSAEPEMAVIAQSNSAQIVTDSIGGPVNTGI